MKPYSIEDTLIEMLSDSVERPIYHSADTRTKELPFVLVETFTDELRIAGNDTWEYTVRFTMKANAHDWTREQFCGGFADLVAAVRSITARGLRMKAADFYTYTFYIRAINEVEADEDDYTQSCECRLVVQL